MSNPQFHTAVRSRAKRLLDVTIASLVVVVSLPITILTIVAIRVLMGPPALFRQTRPGLNGKPFILFKFRTMQGESLPGREALDDARRLTPLGRFLRRTSIDEVPQLINVLHGAMSLVGPRPLLLDYLPLYSPAQQRRHEVKPGITGWTQTSGRNALSWEQKFDLDVWYVDHWSFALDVKILALTFRQVLTGKGVSARDHVTMARFHGSTSISRESFGPEPGGSAS